MKKKSYKFFGIKYKVKILRIAVGLKKKGQLVWLLELKFSFHTVSPSLFSLNFGLLIWHQNATELELHMKIYHEKPFRFTLFWTEKFSNHPNEILTI